MAGTVHSALVGLKDLYYALLTKDDETGVTYGTPAKVSAAITAKISPKVDSAVLYADDGPAETAIAMGEVDVELETQDLPLEIQAAVLGHTLNAATGVMVKNSSDTAPYLALGFKAKKANGKYRFIWLLKGKFSPAEEEYKTSEDKVTYNTPKIKASFVKRANDNNWQYIADEDSGFVGAETWFTAVYAPPAG
jgi:phi13 family phage major tail protein